MAPQPVDPVGSAAPAAVTLLDQVPLEEATADDSLQFLGIDGSESWA